VKAGRLHAKLFSQTIKTMEKREENGKIDVLKREKYLWKDGGEVARGEITLRSARRVGSSRG
jgi:hypothetical protein